ncbi:helix-turn-helix domain-containing protein [Sediminibacillus terrae]|uniref:helix-turn-helix domain-containing protein n=1 Tax=Sediminibacillus terrae TaxID=1562106 RepID=UPI001F275116|nr:helix-turn-helix transcriptional regulator [Sediminibacillus terrae]
MLGKRLRYLREREGLSQLSLAKKLQIPNQNISNYERGFRQPDYETLQKMADFFDVTTDYLLGRSDSYKKDKEEEDFQKFINDPELQHWYYEELPQSEEDQLRQLRKMWEIIKGDKK